MSASPIITTTTYHLGNPTRGGSGSVSGDLFAPRFVWGYYARWWDCISECLDMCGHTGTIPGLIQERWSYVDLYETEDECIAATQGQAEAEFRSRYPWITNYHIRLIGEYRPPAKKKARRRKSRRANDEMRDRHPQPHAENRKAH